MAKGNKKKKNMIPKLKRDVNNFLLNEEGKISRKNIAKLGISLTILGLMLEPRQSVAQPCTEGEIGCTHINAGAEHFSNFFPEGAGGHNSFEDHDDYWHHWEISHSDGTS